MTLLRYQMMKNEFFLIFFGASLKLVFFSVRLQRAHFHSILKCQRSMYADIFSAYVGICKVYVALTKRKKNVPLHALSLR